MSTRRPGARPQSGMIRSNSTCSRRSELDISAFERSNHSDRKSTRLNSSHSQISYAVFCLKKKNVRIDVLLADPPDLVTPYQLNPHPPPLLPDLSTDTRSPNPSVHLVVDALVPSASAGPFE